MATFHYDNLAKNLPDCYKKDSDSNNYKILEIERRANGLLRSSLNSIDSILDLETASGATLDMYGERFGQPRGNASDAQYKIMIKAKIMRSFCGGGYKDIVDALCYTFNCGLDDVLLLETETPLNVTVYRIPMNAIITAGFSPSEAEKLIKNLLPVGVMLESVMFEGTFEFGGDEYELDENAGFSEAENGTYGGYLGYASSSETEGDLPI